MNIIILFVLQKVKSEKIRKKLLTYDYI